MGRINVTFPIFADSDVQPPEPPDVTAAEYGATKPLEHMQMCIAPWYPGGTTCRCEHGVGSARLGCDSRPSLGSCVAASGHSEPSRYGELVAPGESGVATSCKLTWLVLG